MKPVLVFTQGDPAGIGPEILLKVLLGPNEHSFRPLLIVERAALVPLRPVLPDLAWERLHFLDDLAGLESTLSRGSVGLGEAKGSGERAHKLTHPAADDAVLAFDPLARDRVVVPGRPEIDDARGALAALDLGASLVRSGRAAALVTAPISKLEIARYLDPNFRGHTDYLAEACGLTRYGRDYLMAFLAPEMRVALLTVHMPLRQALDALAVEPIVEALACLNRHTGGKSRIALAGLNPHAGESGLLGREEIEILEPAVAEARARGLDVFGPSSADSLFARARAGAFDWVLALYHDQGLIAVKTAAFGQATNWTLGLPYLRTSVDHGTAYDVAGRGIADASSLAAVIATTLELVAEKSRDA